MVKTVIGALVGLVVGTLLGVVASSFARWVVTNQASAEGVQLFFSDLGRSINGQLGAIVGTIAGATAAVVEAIKRKNQP